MALDTLSGANYYYKAGSDAATSNATGYTAVANRLVTVSLVTIVAPATGPIQVVEATDTGGFVGNLVSDTSPLDPISGASYYYKSGSDSATGDATGYSTFADRLVAVSLVTVGVSAPATGALQSREASDDASLKALTSWNANLHVAEGRDLARFYGAVRWLGRLRSRDSADLARFYGTVTGPPAVRHTDPSYEGENADIQIMITSNLNDRHVIELDEGTVIARLTPGRGPADRVTIAEFQQHMTPGATMFASRPTSPYVGMMHQVTDSSVNAFGAVVTGGGVYRVMAWFNGTNWTVIGA